MEKDKNSDQLKLLIQLINGHDIGFKFSITL